MPGDNCAVFGCGTCRRTKGIGIFKLPSPLNAEHEKWRKEWLNQLTKTRIVDKEFQSQIEKGKVYTCEKHFDPKDIIKFTSDKMVKKKPKFGALPTLNLPNRSHDSVNPSSRPYRSVVQHQPRLLSIIVKFLLAAKKVMIQFGVVNNKFAV